MSIGDHDITVSAMGKGITCGPDNPCCAAALAGRRGEGFSGHSGGSDGRLVSLFRHATTASAARLRCVMNRINPDLFTGCFTSWVEECWRHKLDLVTLGNMRANGVRSLAVLCWQCHHRTILSADP
jgi:hypothetical protein